MDYLEKNLLGPDGQAHPVEVNTKQEEPLPDKEDSETVHYSVAAWLKFTDGCSFFYST